jgi:predicted 2-oxoglutarate/Fe(II)-dependent dioxygenase YbiX/peroxiredoxin
MTTGAQSITLHTDLLLPGEAAPYFHARALGGNPRFAFDTVAGRHVLMLFFGSAAEPDSAAALARVDAASAIFDDANAAFFGISHDPDDEAKARIAPSFPGRRYFLDFDHGVADKYRVAAPPGDRPDRFWLLLDPMLRIIGRFPLAEGARALQATAHFSRAVSPVSNAPVLTIPRVLDPNTCRDMIAMYEAGAPEQSGFMREVDGKTVLVHDAGHKVRHDFGIVDPKWLQLLRACISRRLAPQLRRAFQFEASRMERYLIACYDAQTGGHFAPHRDNTTKGTAHRRFAVTINLNAEDYEGGDLSFPEFGPQTYRAPTGGAVVFSCSLLHRAHPVTQGRRYAFLPFLYDDAAAELRLRNNVHLGEGAPVYQGDLDRI